MADWIDPWSLRVASSCVLIALFTLEDMMNRAFAFLAAAAMLAGCATRGANYAPIVDMQGKEEGKFAADLADCQAYAQRQVDAATGAVVGGLASALIGAFLAPKGQRNYVAGRAGALGALGGAGAATESREVIIKRCLAGRGYSVLN